MKIWTILSVFDTISAGRHVEEPGTPVSDNYYADLPTTFACTLGPRVQNAWKMYPMLGIARRILIISSMASNQL